MNETQKGKRFERFTSLVLGINRSVQRIKSEEMAAIGLKGVHVNCLFYLGTSDGLSQSELCKFCGEDKAYISRAVGRLEELGAVNIEQSDRTKKYNALITLTDSGKKLAERVFDAVDRAVFAGSEGIADDERIVFYKCLELVNNNLEKYIVTEK